MKPAIHQPVHYVDENRVPICKGHEGIWRGDRDEKHTYCQKCMLLIGLRKGIEYGRRRRG